MSYFETLAAKASAIYTGFKNLGIGNEQDPLQEWWPKEVAPQSGTTTGGKEVRQADPSKCDGLDYYQWQCSWGPALIDGREYIGFDGSLEFGCSADDAHFLRPSNATPVAQPCDATLNPDQVAGACSTIHGYSVPNDSTSGKEGYAICKNGSDIASLVPPPPSTPSSTPSVVINSALPSASNALASPATNPSGNGSLTPVNLALIGAGAAICPVLIGGALMAVCAYKAFRYFNKAPSTRGALPALPITFSQTSNRYSTGPGHEIYEEIGGPTLYERVNAVDYELPSAQNAIAYEVPSPTLPSPYETSAEPYESAVVSIPSPYETLEGGVGDVKPRSQQYKSVDLSFVPEAF